MLSLPPQVRIYLARGATDLRKAIDGLAACTRDLYELDPMSGHLFVFCNRSKNRIKILYWETSGYWLLLKRLEKGRFAWPNATNASILSLSSTELHALLGGLDFERARRRNWYDRKPRKV
ncbi:MAG: IS66 family insertion sequence element accessory protein TnpB [Planctomycetes bacterium]|nr:IS66 family insertion sequence element accessory protein TnpB [Planctomycetota bacterium]